MIIWIKRCARILAIGSFFIVFFLGIDPSDPFDKTALLMAFLKGCLGALLFWAVGFVCADIVIKGLVAGVPADEKDPLEGGVLQRLYDVKTSLTPEAESLDKDHGKVSAAGKHVKEKMAGQKTP
jgi:hypothetical protein